MAKNEKKVKNEVTLRAGGELRLLDAVARKLAKNYPGEIKLMTNED